MNEALRQLGETIGLIGTSVNNLNTQYSENTRLIDAILKLIGDYKIALLGSEDNKEVNYFTSDNDISTGNSIYKENSNFSFSPQRRKTKTLDTLLQSKSFYDLIKMDVQGSELDIIKGGMSVINNTKFLLLELQIIEFNKGAPRFYEVMSFLNKINFEIIDILD